jgi:hypothetical protein
LARAAGSPRRASEEEGLGGQGEVGGALAETHLRGEGDGRACNGFAHAGGRATATETAGRRGGYFNLKLRRPKACKPARGNRKPILFRQAFLALVLPEPPTCACALRLSPSRDAMPTKEHPVAQPAEDDPFDAVLRPPADETPEQRAVRIAKEAEATRINQQIEESLHLERQRQRKKKVVRVLLLGQSESGASTFTLTRQAR